MPDERATETQKHPRIGVGVIIRREDGRIVVGRRRGSHGLGQLALPGGALEWKESIAQCASRETMEETGLDIAPEAWIAPFAMCESVIDENNHWLTVLALADVAADCEPANVEPHKCEGWTFMSIGDVREADNLFLPLRKLVNDRTVAL